MLCQTILAGGHADKRVPSDPLFPLCRTNLGGSLPLSSPRSDGFPQFLMARTLRFTECGGLSMEEFPQESKSCEMERQKLTLQISDVAPLTLGDQRPSVRLCRMVLGRSWG